MPVAGADRCQGGSRHDVEVRSRASGSHIRPQEAQVVLDVERLTQPAQLADLAPVLADLQNAQLEVAPHYRPITARELEDFAAADKRFRDRAILVARHDEAVAGWCHLEPPGTARTGGDLYPYVGGEVAFQPGLPFAAAGHDGVEVVRALLYGACQIRAQQACLHLELFAPQTCETTRALRDEGLQPADDWATYVVPVSEARRGSASLTVRAVEAGEVQELPTRLSDLGLIAGDFAASDLRQLLRQFPGSGPDGLLLALRSGEVVGYAAVTVDPVYASATGRDRAWLGLGPLGLGIRGAAEHPELLGSLVSAACIKAFAQGASELAIVAGLGGRGRGFWEGLGFRAEVRWRRWRVDL